MDTLVLGTPPPELEALLARRHRAGVDRLDEVWHGVRHLVAGPSFEHGRVAHDGRHGRGDPLPRDESWQKLPFYAAHDVDEVLLVDPAQRAIHWLALGDGQYEPVEASRLIELGPAALAQQIDWP